tara:strand:+ start:2049 stop:2765 length:717 start_codon:yes stop_codon:yes gene_type:complete
MASTKTLRRFTSEGLAQFELCHARLHAGLPDQMGALLEKDDLTEKISDYEIGRIKPFKDRMAAAKQMDTIVSALNLDTFSIRSDAGLWTWLTACWWEHLAGKRVRSLPCYKPEIGNFQRYYRHYLGGAWDIYNIHRDNPERALILLCQPVNAPGDIIEGIASRKDLVTNKPLMQAMTDLYFDMNKRKPKPGAGSKISRPGSSRRFVATIQQFERTFATSEMTSEQILDLLPPEFDEFK